MPLTVRFLLLVLPVLALVAVIFLGVITHFEDIYAQRVNEQATQRMVERFAFLLTEPVWVFDHREAEVIMKSTVDDPQLVCAHLTYANMMSKPLTVGKCQHLEGLRKYQVPIERHFRSNDVHIGNLVVYGAPGSGQHSVYKELLNLGALTALLFLALIGCVVVAFRITILRPLARVSDSLQHYQRTGVRRLVDWNTRDELGLLISEYNDSLKRQVESEKNLANQLRFEQTLKDTIPIPIILVDSEGRLRDPNPAFYRQLKLDREVELPRAQTLFPGVDLEQLLATETEQVAVQEISIAEGPLSGQTWILNASPFTNVAGIKEGVVLGLLNITERMRAEREVSEARDRAEQALEHLKQAQENLIQSEKLASLGRLVAGIAHEINTPVGNGLTVATSLMDKNRALRQDFESGVLKKSDLSGYLDAVDEAANLMEHNLARAAEQIQNFKQVAVDQTSSQHRGFDLREVVDEVVYTLRPAIKHSPHRVEVSVPEGIHMASFPGPLGQVITNCFNNALLHGFEGVEAGVIRITGEILGDDRVRLTISDDGRGIPEAHLDKVFDPFFTTRMGRGGSGLGLNLVYNIVTGVLGGTVQLSSVEGEGTQVVIELPRQLPESVGG